MTCSSWTRGSIDPLCRTQIADDDRIDRTTWTLDGVVVGNGSTFQFSQPTVGTRTLGLRLVDPSGNPTNATFSLRVVDRTAPVLQSESVRSRPMKVKSSNSRPLRRGAGMTQWI